MAKDIIIIGGGPGGYIAGIRAAQLGAKVRLIERDKIGGTCLNVGCIPTKALYKNAEILKTLRKSEDFGIHIMDYSIDIDTIQRRKNEIVHQLVEGVEKLLFANGVEVISGEAQFIDANTIRVTTSNGEEIVLQGENIIIATGSKVQLPPIEGIDTEGVMTSKELLEFKEIPQRLVIVGGGVIGMEFACIFQAMGSQVRVVEYQKDILPMVDPDVSKRLASLLKKDTSNEPMDIHTKTAVKKIAKEKDGLLVLAENKKGEITFPADKVLIATGRKPSFDSLNFDDIKIQYTDYGIEVDENFQTNIEGIYAIGDINGKTLLAHVASSQGIAAVEHIMGVERTINQDLVPNCVFTFPEIASVGITEKIAKEKKIPYKSSKFQFGANSKALTMGEGDGFVKVICDEKDSLIGMQILGPHASDLIHEGALGINKAMKAEDIANTIHGHPTLSEAILEAALGIKGQAIHMMPGKRREIRE